MREIAGRLGIDRKDIAGVVALFAASRMLYWWLGVRFDTSPFPVFMQFIDEELLTGRFLESIWYYHAHPPLLNVFVGIGKKVFGSEASAFFSVCHHALGVALALCVYAMTHGLSASRLAAYAATALVVFSPSFVLYENWLMYCFPATALLTMAALALYRYAQTRTTRWCAAFFALLAVLLLTRSVFHLGWMFLIALLLVIVMRHHWKQVLVAAVVPFIVVAFWYGKNYYYFGSFSGSTMLGIGLSNITTLMVPAGDLMPLVQNGELSQYALISRYDHPDMWFSLDVTPDTGIAVLDTVKKKNWDDVYNFNHKQLVEVNRHYTRDGLEVMRRFPSYYVLDLAISNRLFFSPSSMNPYFSAENRAAVRPMERILNPVLYGTDSSIRYVGRPHYGVLRTSPEAHMSVPLIVAWILVLGYAYTQARRAPMTKDPDVKARGILIGFIILSVLYIYAVSTTIELGENNRYRFMTEPLFMVLAATAVTELLRRARRVLPALRSAPGETGRSAGSSR